MAIERSPYEGTFNDLNGMTALGRVVEVDAVNRRCHVKTIGKVCGLTDDRGRGTDDQDLFNVQWLTSAGSDSGAELTCIPTVGQTGVILYINCEPYLIGFFRPLRTSDDTEGEDTDPVDNLVTQGDILLSTTGTNSLTVRLGGSVEIDSTKVCYTHWLPSNIIRSECGDLELSTDGGYENWTLDTDTKDTTLDRMSWDNLQPTYGVFTQEGTTDTGTIYRQIAGALDENGEIPSPSYDHQIDPSGTETKVIGLTQFAQVGLEDSNYTFSTDITNKQSIMRTPTGHTVVFDDNEEDGSISIIHGTGASIQISGNGDISLQSIDGTAATLTESGLTVLTSNGALIGANDSITLTSAAGAQVAIADTMTITDSSGKQTVQLSENGVLISSQNPMTVSAPSVSVTAGTLALGNNTGELLSLIYQLVDAISSVQVITAVGPSGPLKASPQWAAVVPLLVQLQTLTGEL